MFCFLQHQTDITNFIKEIAITSTKYQSLFLESMYSHMNTNVYGSRLIWKSKRQWKNVLISIAAIRATLLE